MRSAINLCLFGLALALLPLSSSIAEVTKIVAKDSGSMGLYGEREYIWVTADMYGTVARENGEAGHYRVPVVLMYPAIEGNGFGFVDLINSAAFAAYHEGKAPGGQRSVYYVGDIVFSDYLRREGFTYVAAQWAKLVTYALGTDYGVIEDARDGIEIIKDTARLLRAPLLIEGEVDF